VGCAGKKKLKQKDVFFKTRAYFTYGRHPISLLSRLFFLAGDDFGNQVKGNDRELTSSMAYLFSALQVSQKVHLVMKPRPCFDGWRITTPLIKNCSYVINSK
jgi:hypothetical protein